MHRLLNESDIYLYLGSIAKSGHEALTEIIQNKEAKKETAYLIPITFGGDPDAGFRIARAMGHYYPSGVKCFIPDVCKSAGTLITIGSEQLIISDKGELGPLDIQIQNKEELFETSSGLDIMQAINVLQETVQVSFTKYLIDLRQSGLGTKIAAKIASEMATNMVSPISSQIDPLRLGEHQRALRIATAYGNRLNEKFKNTSNEHIEKLIIGYPAHSFVIDRKEASTLFKRVRSSSEDEKCLEFSIRATIPNIKMVAGQKEPIVIDLEQDLELFLQNANDSSITQELGNGGENEETEQTSEEGNT